MTVFITVSMISYDKKLTPNDAAIISNIAIRLIIKKALPMFDAADPAAERTVEEAVAAGAAFVPPGTLVGAVARCRKFIF